MSKATHVMHYGYDSSNNLVVTGMETPAGIAGFISSKHILTSVIEYHRNGFGYGISYPSLRNFKAHAKSHYRAVRYQKAIINK